MSKEQFAPAKGKIFFTMLQYLLLKQKEHIVLMLIIWYDEKLISSVLMFPVLFGEVHLTIFILSCSVPLQACKTMKRHSRSTPRTNSSGMTPREFVTWSREPRDLNVSPHPQSTLPEVMCYAWHRTRQFCNQLVVCVSAWKIYISQAGEWVLR